jgi:hypothetical protein
MNKARHSVAFRTRLEIMSRLLLVASLVSASWADAPESDQDSGAP